MISSGGGGGGAPRVSIPNSARKTIQNIKEIAGNHSDEEVYAMLRECNMDPNETTQKLLLQDTFHEVKRKRDRRKENVSNKEPADASWRSGIQGRGGRGGRGSYSSRYVSHDIIGAKNFASAKESAANQGPDKGAKTSAIQNVENKSLTLTSSSVSLIVNGPSKEAHLVPPHGATSQMPVSSGITSSEEKVTAETSKIHNTASPEINIKSGQTTVPGGAHEQSVPSNEQSVPSTEQPSPSLTVAPAMGVCASVSESVLEPSLDSCTTDAVSAIKRQVGNQITVVEPTNDRGISVVMDSSSSLSEKTAPEATSSYTHGKLPSKSHGYEINHISEESQARPTSSGTGTSGSRPPSNYSNRSQQLVGPQKAGPVKEWKPKQANTNLAQTSGAVGHLGVATTAAGAAANTQASEETTSKLQKKLEELQFEDGQHVIFPSHIQVPEYERTVLSFGSFTASFGLPSTFANGPDDEKSSTPLSESSQEIEENVEEPSLSVENVSPAAQEDDHSAHPQSSVDIPENLSPGEAGISNISAAQEYHQSQQETSLAPEGPQYSVVQTAPVYSTFGLIPPMVGNPFTGLGNSESQARDTSRVSGFVVQQPFDPSASYYTQVYRPGADSDGRYSPFLPPGPATKYPGSLSSQADQSQQESGNSLVQPASGSATVTQAAGVMQNSIAVTQPPVPVFRQPAGVHISHYPPNYIPYGPYFSPFYVQPGSVHPFISNAAFPQQHPAGTIYPPVAAAAAPVKYPISQFKTGTNNALSNHAGMAAGYGPYSSSQTGYSPSSAASTVNSTNEDLTGPQYKENSVYLAGQQSEGSTVWIPAPPRDVPNLQAGSFYSLPQGQHVTFTPTQAGHGTFPGIFHPTQMGSATVHPLLQQSQTVAGAVEMVGPQGGVYPPPQRAPINWANNY